MSRQILVLFSLLIFFVFVEPTKTFAAFYRSESGTITTKVGSPPIPSNDLVRAAEDIKSAYDNCSDGYTYPKPGLVDCLKNNLKNMNYSDDVVNAFESRRAKSITENGCTECLGFVGIVLALISGSSDTLMYGAASIIPSLPSFTAGNYTYVRLAPNDEIKAGDIAATGSGGGYNFGHIAIVKNVQGVLFTAIESNANVTCGITNNRTVPRDRYTFFRKT